MTTSTTAHTLSAEEITLGYPGREIVHNVSLVVPRAQITAIIGPNACGKSTLLRGLSRLLTPTSGRVLLDDRDLRSMRTRDVARLISLLPQSPVAPEGVTVADLVGRGRYPHQGWFRRWSPGDDAIVESSMAATGVLELAARSVDELSGGQRQRVWLAMALAQQTDILLLDEPTTYLDITHQIEVLDLLVDLNRDSGATIVMVLHDLNLAARYADHLVAMRDGRIVAEGTPAEVITTQLVQQTFELDSLVVADPVSGTPSVVPIGRHHRPA